METNNTELFEGETNMGNTKKILEKMQKGFDRLDKRMDHMDKRLDHMDKRLDHMDKRLDGMDKRLDKLEHATRDIQLTIENEIRPNIQVIAEGHADINRKLDEALKVENEKEIMKIHLTYLENEVRRIKEKIGESA